MQGSLVDIRDGLRIAVEPKSRARSMPQKVVMNIVLIGYEPFFF